MRGSNGFIDISGLDLLCTIDRVLLEQTKRDNILFKVSLSHTHAK